MGGRFGFGTLAPQPKPAALTRTPKAPSRDEQAAGILHKRTYMFPSEDLICSRNGAAYSAYSNPQNTPLQPLLLCRPSRLCSAADACCSRLGFSSSTSLSLELRSPADDLAAAMLQSSSEKSPSCSSKKLRQPCQFSLSRASTFGKWLCVRIGMHLSRAEKTGCFMFLARDPMGLPQGEFIRLARAWVGVGGWDLDSPSHHQPYALDVLQIQRLCVVLGSSAVRCVEFTPRQPHLFLTCPKDSFVTEAGLHPPILAPAWDLVLERDNVLLPVAPLAEPQQHAIVAGQVPVVRALGLLGSEARAAERRGVEVAVEAGAVARGGGGEVGRGAAAADAVVGRLPGVGGPVSVANELAPVVFNKTFVKTCARTADTRRAVTKAREGCSLTGLRRRGTGGPSAAWFRGIAKWSPRLSQLRDVLARQSALLRASRKTRVRGLGS